MVLFKFFQISFIFCFIFQMSEESNSKALFLTPYIKSGRIEKARKLCAVRNLSPKVLSYSGFITVDKKCNSNLWFWFFPSKSDPVNNPITLWLNGGPGLSSMFGLFLENGPYVLTQSRELKLRRLTWTARSSVIYVDAPVGTGFSFSDYPYACYSKNQSHIAKHLMRFLNQFFVLFPEYRKNPFYLFGESYGAKYATGVAYYILKSNSSIRLYGLGLGNGIVDPRNQEVYANNLYHLGIIDKNVRRDVLKGEKTIRDLIDEKKFEKASQARKTILRNYRTMTGYKHWYNYLESDYGELFRVDFDDFLNRENVRRALHVGNLTRHTDASVTRILAEEMMKPVRKWFEYVIERRRTLLYYGQMDLIVPYSGAINFINKLNWSRAENFKKANRKIWKVDGKLAGYIKSDKVLTEVLVRNAGHSVPADQPLWAFNLYNKFIFRYI